MNATQVKAPKETYLSCATDAWNLHVFVVLFFILFRYLSSNFYLDDISRTIITIGINEISWSRQGPQMCLLRVSLIVLPRESHPQTAENGMWIGISSHIAEHKKLILYKDYSSDYNQISVQLYIAKQFVGDPSTPTTDKLYNKLQYRSTSSFFR